MAEKIFEEFGAVFRVELVPSRGGVFEVDVDGTLIFSKKATQRHADYEADVAPGLRTAGD